MPYVCVVPVRMSEAWLLFDEKSIRQAAENSRGTVWLDLPPLRRVEGIRDPKTVLSKLVEKASELKGRSLDKLMRRVRPRTVADFIEDFGPLRQLPAFRAFEDDIRYYLQQLG